MCLGSGKRKIGRPERVNFPNKKTTGGNEIGIFSFWPTENTTAGRLRDLLSNYNLVAAAAAAA